MITLDIVIDGKTYLMENGQYFPPSPHNVNDDPSLSFFQYSIGSSSFIVRDWLPHVDLTGKTTLQMWSGTGAWSLEMARRGATRAVIYEPDPHAAQYVQGLADQAGLTNVEVFNKAIAPKPLVTVTQGKSRSMFHSDVWDKVDDNGKKIDPSYQWTSFEVPAVPTIAACPDPPDYCYVNAGASTNFIMNSMPLAWWAAIDGILINWPMSRVNDEEGWDTATQIEAMHWYMALLDPTHELASQQVRGTSLDLEKFKLERKQGLAWSLLFTKRV